MNRQEAISIIMENIKDENIVVSSLGMTSRELYHIKNRPLNLYLIGGMGSALAVAHGIALNTDRKVIAIIGDGEVLMGLGSIMTVNKTTPINLEIYILQNNEHASTGGQKLSYCNFHGLSTKIFNIPIKNGKGNAGRIPLTGKQIKERFLRALNE